MSGLQKNVASQKWRVFAFDNNGDPVTGDAANITAKIAKDWGTATATNDVNPTEVEDGYYLFDLTQAETNANVLDLYPESSTANTYVIGVTGTIYTVALNFSALGIESDGDLTKVNLCDTNTDMRGTDSAALASVCTEARLAELDAANLPATTDSILADTGTDGVLLAATATSAQLVDNIFDEPLTGGTHNVANSLGKRIRELQEFGTYEDDSVWIDTIAGSPGTTDYESGTILNKVSNIADSNTIGTSLGLAGRAIIPGSSVTLAAAQEYQNFWGNNWTLALGGQSISATHIQGASVSGICTGAVPPEFHECDVGSVTIPPCTFRESAIEGTVTLPVGEVHFHACQGEFGGTLDFGATVANTTIHWTDFSGDLVVDNLGASGIDILYIRGQGKITLNASCVGGTINWDGHFTIVNNGTTSNINGDDITDTAIAILADTNELQTDWTNGGRLDLILDEVTVQGDTNESKLDIIDTVVDNIPTTAEFEARTFTAAQIAAIVANAETTPPVTFTGGTTTTAVLGNVDGVAASAVTDQYRGRILVFNTGTLDEQATDILSYDGPTKTATITAVTTAVTSGHTAILC